jgi:hypothetical protein
VDFSSVLDVVDGSPKEGMYLQRFLALSKSKLSQDDGIS